ncbi:sodium:calcium antiporter [Haloquadratum walsbyi]|jgi:Ca2+/Na+ antiporter|uniref:Ca2+/Na+ antiporter n=1 Tax=Haloquadratum walsbyi J07HQW2 TaxID=1238425 RepID=U1PQ94_9EURY|nr:sodium:calcium antiporter [Haloquadratum walsbyi]ERG94491.1 MAG: Ca2+/Na+ antiporter [Haloquadratum walsbyi J07HQW2]
MVLAGVVPQTPSVFILVILGATGLVWVGTGWLEGAAERLSTHYGLPPVVQGSVVVAIGSSFPEFASVVVTASNGVFSMGIGAIVGSAIFNILVIPALSGMLAQQGVESNRDIVYKEAQFYMIAVSALVITFALAVIYIPAPDRGAFVGMITRPLAAIPLFVYVLYLFIQWQEVSDYTDNTATESIAVGQQWGRLIAGLVAILIAVEQMVGAVEGLGSIIGIPEFLAGVTIIAAATSLPDTLVSVRAARSGDGTTSLGNVLGSNTFDLLVVIPIGVLIVGTVPVNFATAVPMFGILTLATVLLFTVLRTDLTLTQREAYILGVAYAVFIIWIIAESAGVTGILRTV